MTSSNDMSTAGYMGLSITIFIIITRPFYQSRLFFVHHKQSRMEWPDTDKASGKAATTQTAKDVWSAFCCGNETLLQKIAGCKNWRNDYMKVVEELVAYQCKASPDEAVRMAQAGLDCLHSKMVFRTDDGTQTIPAMQAFHVASTNPTGYTTKTTTGTVLPPPNGYQFPLASPHGTNGAPIFLHGNDAKIQLDTWSHYGCMEDSAAQHAGFVCSLTDVTPLVKNKIFVLLGATSAMGPTKSLLCIPGAHVLGVARGGRRLEDLQQWFAQHGSTEATLQTPEHGADMLLDGPKIAKWIVETAPMDQEVVICHLAYMDGEAHVRVSVAMDLITQYVCKHYKGRVSLSFLTSPATVHAIPDDAAQDALARYESRSSWESLAGIVSLGGWLQTTNVWNNGGILNGLAHMQGPNYALAKTAQQWRCMVAYWKDGLTVSAPHGPPTRTESMVRYATIAAVLEGMQTFEPILSFDVAPTSSLMTAILLFQISEETSVCRPVNKVLHPVQVLWDGSVHGGSWRCPYSTESAGTLSFLLGKTMKAPYKPIKSLAPKPKTDEQV
jgi:hypothetical protein